MKNILIVEDEDDIAMLLQMRLHQGGYSIVRASDGTSALTAVRKSKPDLVILDLMLPAVTGTFILQEIRESDDLAEIPVIILTGMQGEEIKQRVLDQGVQAYMQKPYNADELLMKIKDLIGE